MLHVDKMCLPMIKNLGRRQFNRKRNRRWEDKFRLIRNIQIYRHKIYTMN